MSVTECVGNYFKNLTLVTRHNRAWVRPSIQMQTHVRSQAHQQSTLQASIRDDIAGTDHGADSPRGLVASVDLKDAYLHIQIAPHHTRFLGFALEGTVYQYPVRLFGLALATCSVSDVLCFL